MNEDQSSGDLNLDLIQMVQRARLLHDASARPSDYDAVYWIEAKRAVSGAEYPAPTANAGEWRVALHIDRADALWQRVKSLTAAGALGYKSKISTGPAAGQTDRAARLLCLRTYDAADRADVERVKQALLDMGLRPLEYVPDK